MAARFGAQRLLWGSDVGQSLKWPYDSKVAHARAAARLLNPAEQAAFLHDNAARIHAPR
jgi:predicted TIM-barrel fold metal-dependent hydrolase